MENILTIKEDGDGFRWHLSRPGRPGEESDSYPTVWRCLKDFMEEFPKLKIRHIIVEEERG